MAAQAAPHPGTLSLPAGMCGAYPESFCGGLLALAVGDGCGVRGWSRCLLLVLRSGGFRGLRHCGGQLRSGGRDTSRRLVGARPWDTPPGPRDGGVGVALMLHRGCPTRVCMGQAGCTPLRVWTSRGHPDDPKPWFRVIQQPPQRAVGCRSSVMGSGRSKQWLGTDEPLCFSLPPSGPAGASAAARALGPLTWAAAASCWSERACVSGCSGAPTL